METKTVNVPNVGCNGCVNTIKGELSEMPGVVSVDGDPNTKLITVSCRTRPMGQPSRASWK